MLSNETLEPTFAQHLKEQTTALHNSVDNLVMSVRPFDNKENYIKFLKLQSVFHKAVDPLYQDTDLNQAIPGLSDMSRYNAVIQDLKDLGEQAYTLAQNLPQPNSNQAIGWLYCAEGSNLGAAFLFKHAQALDYDGQHGARHLAPHPDGRGKHWREFVSHLNALPLSPEAQAQAIEGAKEAFLFYKIVLRETFDLPEDLEVPVNTSIHH